MLTLAQRSHHWPLWVIHLPLIYGCSRCSPLPTGTNPTPNQRTHQPLHSYHSFFFLPSVYWKSLINDNWDWAALATVTTSSDENVEWLREDENIVGKGECCERLVRVEQIFSHISMADLPGCFNYWDAWHCRRPWALFICSYKESCENTTCCSRLHIRPQKYLQGTSV